MNIRNWPMDQIMQLPDCCFGRRFLVIAEVRNALIVEAFDISEVAFPENCVLWNVSMQMSNENILVRSCRLALGDHLPADGDVMDALEPLIYGLGLQGPEPRQIMVRPGTEHVWMPMRQPLRVAGRRLVLGVSAAVGKEVAVRVIVTVSSLPTEVPDWLLSEYRRSR
ncbi:hypothetical protein ES707_15014 [subsurface metagenome]